MLLTVTRSLSAPLPDRNLDTTFQPARHAANARQSDLSHPSNSGLPSAVSVSSPQTAAQQTASSDAPRDDAAKQPQKALASTSQQTHHPKHH
jgi:hypothetical protein